jgi:type II secretory pathway predicted ATPase ExeA/cytoskeletal protein CcmA (bactofilin family)
VQDLGDSQKRIMAEEESQTNIIGPSMVISGDVECNVPLVLAGRINGSFSGKLLHITESGRLLGKVVTDTIHCDGLVRGEIFTRVLRLSSSGCQEGTVHAEKLAIEKGARVDRLLQGGSLSAQPSTTNVEESQMASDEVDLSDCLQCFNEERRPCCYEIPGSGRLGLFLHISLLLSTNLPLITVTGEQGTGKSILARKLQQNLPENYLPLFLQGQPGSVVDILVLIARALKVEVDEKQLSAKMVLSAVKENLQQQYLLGKKVVLLIDDGDLLYQATLEGIVRLLTTTLPAEMKRDVSDKPLQIVVIGKKKMSNHLLLAFGQYFDAHDNCMFYLLPLSLSETADYLRLALMQSDAVSQRQSHQVFPDETIREIHGLSGGRIEMINQLADRAIRSAAASGKSVVTPGILLTLDL